jgi:hypothetical protein
MLILGDHNEKNEKIETFSMEKMGFGKPERSPALSLDGYDLQF